MKRWWFWLLTWWRERHDVIIERHIASKYDDHRWH